MDHPDTSPKELNPDWLLLFERALAEDCDQAAIDELTTLLMASPAAASAYLQYAAMHADLRGAVSLERSREVMLPQLKPDAEPVPTRSGWVVGGWVGMFVALAASIVITMMWLQPTAVPVPLATDHDDPGVWPQMVATVRRADQVTWTSGARNFFETDPVPQGTQLQIETGTIEVEMRQGAVLVMEGPASLSVRGPNRAELHYGKLAAVAPPWAVGFRIDTPKLNVIDHGTRFAVEVDRDAAQGEVCVMVDEGEVEVAGVDAGIAPQRLLTGEGVRTHDGQLKQHNTLDDVQHLTKLLPQRPGRNEAVVVADRWADWQPGELGQPSRNGGWSYYSNATSPFGDRSGYQELVWSDRSCYATAGYDPQSLDERLGFVKVHRDGGHPGRGATQASDGLDHYSITAYTLPEDGHYHIEAGWLERPEPKRWDQDHVLDVAIHLNDEPVLYRNYCNRDCFVRFSSDLGQRQAGDVVHVGVGPSGVDHNDRFRWGFYIVRELTKDAEVPGVAATDASLSAE